MGAEKHISVPENIKGSEKTQLLRTNKNTI